jgi:hypothetical protein
MNASSPQDGASAGSDSGRSGTTVPVSAKAEQPLFPAGPEAADASGDLVGALGEAGLHMVQSRLDLARELAGCGTPVEAMAVTYRWTVTRMDQALADQAKVMSAFLALAAPSDQARGPAIGASSAPRG